jgi:hypothetical protein
MLRLRICYLLHQECKLLIRLVDIPEIISVGRVDNVRGKSSSQRIVNLNSDIVDRRLWVFMEVFINSDGVRELDRW